MKRLLLFGFFLGAGLVAMAQNNLLTQTVKGTILDEQSGNVLRGVTVMIEGSKPVIISVTDSAGNFKLMQVPIGRKTIRVNYIGYEEAVIQNLEVTSSKEVVVEIKVKEKIKILKEVTVVSGKIKNRAINETAVVSARQLSIEEATRYSGTRNDPSRMAQNFAGVSGPNDARNDIVIRGN